MRERNRHGGKKSNGISYLGSHPRSAIPISKVLKSVSKKSLLFVLFCYCFFLSPFFLVLFFSCTPGRMQYAHHFKAGEEGTPVSEKPAALAHAHAHSRTLAHTRYCTVHRAECNKQNPRTVSVFGSLYRSIHGLASVC